MTCCAGTSAAAPAWPRRTSPWPIPPSAPAPSCWACCAASPPTVEADQGAGAVPQAIEAAIGRLIAFEMQLGPFAVAQLRIYAELTAPDRQAAASRPAHVRHRHAGQPVRRGRVAGLVVRHRSPNPGGRPTRSSARNRSPSSSAIRRTRKRPRAAAAGSKRGRTRAARIRLLNAWMPPADWGVGAHAKHLRNLYVYFWRWATWKVFDHDPKHNTGIVCFITVAGFLNGPGFQKMRDYLRRTADRIWVIDCSPEGHQPDVPTRIFQGVQQPVCIVLAARSKQKAGRQAGRGEVHRAAGRQARREVRGSGQAHARVEGLAGLPDRLARAVPARSRPATGPATRRSMTSSPTTARASCPAAPGSSPRMRNRCSRRWQKLDHARSRNEKEELFHPHLRNGQTRRPAHRRELSKGLAGYPDDPTPIADETRRVSCRQCATDFAPSIASGSFRTTA